MDTTVEQATTFICCQQFKIRDDELDAQQYIAYSSDRPSGIVAFQVHFLPVDQLLLGSTSSVERVFFCQCLLYNESAFATGVLR